MKLYVLSDLHLEFADFRPDPGAVEAADVIVLAGDIGLGVSAIQWASQSFTSKPIIYVCGNHELYRHHWDDTLADLSSAAAASGVHFLEDRGIVLGGVRFLGTTLWTDFRLHGEGRQSEAMGDFERGLNDCRMISVGTDASPDAKLRPHRILERHIRSRSWLERELATEFIGPTVVVTHHAPHKGSIAPRFRDDPLSPGFASELPLSTLGAARLWIHGHMHDSFDYEVYAADKDASCRVVCNPRGYPLDRRGSRFENSGFDPGLLVQV